MTYIAVPIAVKDYDSAAGQIRLAKELAADMVELRTDYSPSPVSRQIRELIALGHSVGLAVITTCRSSREGGLCSLPDKLRVDILCSAAADGADYIDCEYETFIQEDNGKKITDAIKNSHCRLILSAHNFAGPFENIADLYSKINSCCECIVKIAYKARHINDCFAAFDLQRRQNRQSIILCMGDDGLISRLLSPKFNAFLTFAGIDKSSGTAPGQPSIGDLNNIYHFRSINEHTELYGVIGEPVAHSMSPAVHNAAFAGAELNKLYLPLLVRGDRQGFYDFMDNILARPWLSFRGFSVTIPHKGHAIEYVIHKGEYVEDLTAKIGAANTLIIGANGRISAYNTDYSGAIDALLAAMGCGKSDLHQRKVAVFGAGGVSRAIVAALTDAACNVTIYNRTIEKAAMLAEEFLCRYAPIDKLAKDTPEIIINCTSVGMTPDIDRSPVPAGVIRANMTVFDTVYNPVETLLLRQAKAAGAKIVSGLDMFVNQAAEQYKLFTGRPADVELMRKMTAQLTI